MSAKLSRSPLDPSPSDREPLRARMASLAVRPSSSEEGVGLQARLRLVYGVLAAIVLGLWVLAVGVTASGSHGHSPPLSPARLGHLATGIALVGCWLACLGRSRSRSVLAVIDLGGIVLITTMASATVAAKSGVHVELMAVVFLTLIVTLRAALVPTSPRWTLLVAAIGALPTPIGTWFAVANDATWDAALVPRGTFVVVSSAWALAAVLSAGAIARVVYGLRADVRDARRLGAYTLEEKIGEGGMGVVYRARHALLRRPTAVKLLAPERTGLASAWRFEREVQITSGLTHPNTVAIYDFGRTSDGVFYYAMELLSGMTLQELVDREGPQSSRRVTHILLQISGALAEAHRAGLVHRDIKPANIFICERGGIGDYVKVLDFGLVKDLGVVHDPSLSQANTIKGTPHYMAPESVLDPDAVDARTDLYSLGVLAYLLVTGRTPFDGANLVQICAQHLHVVPELPSHVTNNPIDASLERVIMRCLEKNPDKRPATADELIGTLGVTP